MNLHDIEFYRYWVLFKPSGSDEIESKLRSNMMLKK